MGKQTGASWPLGWNASLRHGAPVTEASRRMGHDPPAARRHLAPSRSILQGAAMADVFRVNPAGQSPLLTSNPALSPSRLSALPVLSPEQETENHPLDTHSVKTSVFPQM